MKKHLSVGMTAVEPLKEVLCMKVRPRRRKSVGACSLASLVVTVACLATAAGAAVVGPAGYTNDFSTRPAAADFSTSSGGIAGGSADITTAAVLDAYVQNVAAGNITTQVTDSSANSPNDPPIRLASAQWTSGGSAYLATRPTGNRATILMATLVNNTGTNCNVLHFSYQLTVGASYAEDVPGQRLYYSFSPASNTWKNLPAVSGLNASTLVSTDVFLSQIWTNGSPLYFLWADDNSANSTESAYEVDNFFASACYTNLPLLGGTLSSDTTLYASNSPYTVASNLIVPSGVTLAIEPGVTVNLRRNCGITVSGRLLADGTSSQPVSFTRYPDDLNWERILFVEAEDSRFRNCVFEYADCAGDHKTAYYATNCAYPMNVAPRDYFEAVVALACHLDFEGCLFTNLFTSDGSRPEGDAIGIFSDDLVHRGPASANIRGCQFRNIGQGINTRYAYVLVENCYFVGKTGDNDDVELYGESSLYGLPPPEVRSNLFDVPCYDDRIHPTRCSAIIHDNIIYGDPSHGDHCIVLRDTCCPIVFNNVMFNSPSGGISIQNGCDALIANNTFYGINSAIKLFDHQNRINYPYCLSAMSGRATVINCIVWNGTNAVDVSGSAGLPFTTFQVNVSYCDLQGGTNSLAVGSNPKYSVNWGPGIMNSNPLFLDAANRNTRLATNSPCRDAGPSSLGVFVTTNTYFEGTNRLTYAVTNDLDVFVTRDLDGVPRPLDGDGNGVVRFDLGAFEGLHPTADSNNDGIPDAWCLRYGLSPIAPNMANDDPDHDGQNNRLEYLGGTDPMNAASYPVLAAAFGISAAGRDGIVAWSNASPAGVVSILTATNILGPWQPRENYFTTDPLGQARLSQVSEPIFCRLLAVDISTNTPLHYTNLLQSYGCLETVAGRGLSNVDVSQWQPSYEGEWATNVCLSRPHIAFGDSRGNVLIVDQRSSSVLKVTPAGRLYTYAGTHIAGNNGDGPGYATNLHLNNPNGGWLGTNDVFYVLHTDNARSAASAPMAL